MSLTEDQSKGLAARFRHFNAERAAPLFHADQTGTHEVKGKGYPAVLMRNGVQWHYDRKARPKAKASAPPGAASRPGLTDDPQLEQPWHVVVEGEGDAVAVLSVGQAGVFCTGGTDDAKRHAALFKGRKVWVLFDGDDPGRRGARSFALAAMEAGAKVHVAALPEDQDPESWLATFETPARALGELQSLLAKAEPLTKDDLRKARDEHDDAAGFETRSVYAARDGDSLLVTVYEPGWDEPQLAVFGPADFGEDVNAAPPYPGGEAEEEAEQQGGLGAAVLRGWRVLDGLRLADRQLVYKPGGADGLGDLIRLGTMVVPPTPSAEAVDPAALWRDLAAYFRRWLQAREADYHVLVAYTLACWRLEDAEFQRAPFLRVYGASGSGKTRTVELLHLVSNVGLYATLTPANLHRVVEQLGEFTLLWDEFNPENMGREDARELMNTMNLSQVRTSRMLRMVPGKNKGDDMRVKAFKVFGPKVFCGYLASEDDGFRRRTISINMSQAGTVPPEKRLVQLPLAAYDEARELRGRMLAWRAAQLDRGLADPLDDPAHAALVGAGITGVVEAWWPLLYVLPTGLDDVHATLLDRALEGEREFHANRQTKLEAFVLEQVVELLRRGTYFMAQEGAAVRLEDIVEAVEPFQRMDYKRAAHLLREMDLSVSRVRIRGRHDGHDAGRKSCLVMDRANLAAVHDVGIKLGVEFNASDIQPDGPANDGGM